MSWRRQDLPAAYSKTWEGSQGTFGPDHSANLPWVVSTALTAEKAEAMTWATFQEMVAKRHQNEGQE